MNIEPQFLTAPDGSRLVVLPEAEYERLLAGDDEGDARAANAVLASIEREGTLPADVLNLILDHGFSAVKAWRKHRGLTTAELGAKTGLSQAFVSKIERQLVYGSRDTRKRLAAALDAPMWALEDE